MRWPLLRWFSVFLVALFLQEDWAAAGPNPSSEDMMRELFKIDQLYSSIARPSLRSESGGMDDHPKVVQRAIIRLQELDRLYADRARPRFGKRTSESNARYAPVEYDSQYMNEQDLGDWLTARR